eukprot:Nitzschia sp. Nitz4//scaffold90_size81538//24516//25772//NITZ4_005316-RA/size81538-processed-gene-0.47-mRNA-1//-1//CDS//3329560002//5905//frame0
MSTYVSPATVAVGVDLGSFNARIATYDTNLAHAVICANHDGHRETRVCNESSAPITEEELEEFYRERLVALATSSAHTKDILVVTSVSNEPQAMSASKMNILTKFGSVITDAAAIALASGLEAETSQRSVLVLDGGASGLKATILSNHSGLWVQDHFSKLDSLTGQTLVEPLAQAVAQQFEQKNRFPRGEVWESKKAKLKLQKACEQSLSTFQRANNVAIHVDSLYEGMDCNVSMSKPKWEHLSSKLATQVKTFCQGLPAADTVVIAGNLHDWLTPIVKTVFADKVRSTPSGVDPSELVALGCTIHSYGKLQQQLQQGSDEAVDPHLPTLQIPSCPVSIAVEAPDLAHTLVAKGSTLPFEATHQLASDLESLNLVQLEPSRKPLATLEGLKASSTIKLQLSSQGRLRISVDGESVIIG